MITRESSPRTVATGRALDAPHLTSLVLVQPCAAVDTYIRGRCRGVHAFRTGLAVITVRGWGSSRGDAGVVLPTRTDDGYLKKIWKWKIKFNVKVSGIYSVKMFISQFSFFALYFALATEYCRILLSLVIDASLHVRR